MTQKAGQFDKALNRGTRRCKQCGALRQEAHIDRSSKLCTTNRYEPETAGCLERSYAEIDHWDNGDGPGHDFYRAICSECRPQEATS